MASFKGLPKAWFKCSGTGLGFMVLGLVFRVYRLQGSGFLGLGFMAYVLGPGDLLYACSKVQLHTFCVGGWD